MSNKKPVEGEKRAFLTGNETVAWAALAGGADIMYGYPITPQNQVMHTWSRIIPPYNRKFLQTEDEISAGFANCAGALAGKKSFTATAGPGNALMQEPQSMAEAMRIPAVFIIQQRGGPSSGTVIYSQQELTLTTYGGNGEGWRIVYSVCNHQEIYDYTIKAFNTAWTYRFPTYVMGDGYQAELREALTIYDPEERGIKMVEPQPMVGMPGKPGVDRPPVHLVNIYSLEEELYDVCIKYQMEFDRISGEITESEGKNTENPDVLVIGHGVVFRSIHEAVKEMMKDGLNVGYFRPVTVRPMDVKALRNAVKNAKKVLVAESSLGQLERQIKAYCYGLTTPISGYFLPGMGIVATDIEREVKALLKK
ncbi:MAG: transketolase C-terminal domain-containing protein [Thermodesulfobacteriota bacterium]|nr:transketolase C-terminal domain-containing protein [Thermodesulfobacteriota bacterium]